jgi:hypothetical protein
MVTSVAPVSSPPGSLAGTLKYALFDPGSRVSLLQFHGMSVCYEVAVPVLKLLLERDVGRAFIARSRLSGGAGRRKAGCGHDWPPHKLAQLIRNSA